MIRVRFIRFFDGFYKVLILTTLTLLAHYTSAYLRGRYDYSDYIETVKKAVEEKSKKQAFINNKSFHVFAEDLSTKTAIYQMIANASRGLSSLFVIATSVTEADPVKEKLIDYKVGNINAYRVNIVMQGGVMDMRSLINALSASLPNIYWQELIIDSKKFPSKYASITFYVFTS